MDKAEAIRLLVCAAAERYEAAGVAVPARLRELPVDAPASLSPQPAALAALPAAIDGMPPGALRDGLRTCWDGLPWVCVKLAEAEGIDQKFAFAELLGPAAPGRIGGFRFGFYLQVPGVLYPPHVHAAEEFYCVLSGDCEWRRNDSGFIFRRPGSVIHHQPWDLHAMRTRALPMLSMWIWRGDIDYATYRFLKND